MLARRPVQLAAIAAQHPGTSGSSSAFRQRQRPAGTARSPGTISCRHEFRLACRAYLVLQHLSPGLPKSPSNGLVSGIQPHQTSSSNSPRFVPDCPPAASSAQFQRWASASQVCLCAAVRFSPSSAAVSAMLLARYLACCASALALQTSLCFRTASAGRTQLHLTVKHPRQSPLVPLCVTKSRTNTSRVNHTIFAKRNYRLVNPWSSSAPLQRQR